MTKIDLLSNKYQYYHMNLQSWVNFGIKKFNFMKLTIGNMKINKPSQFSTKHANFSFNYAKPIFNQSFCENISQLFISIYKFKHNIVILYMVK